MSRTRLWLALLVCALLAISCGGGSLVGAPEFPEETQPPSPAAEQPAPTPEPEPPCAPDTVTQAAAHAARGLDVMTAPGELPSLRVAGDSSQKITLKQTRVDATITGLVADVEVRQTYENGYAKPIETTYVFPLPENAAVYRMTMVIGARKIEAVVKEREAARRTYETAKRAGQTAALLSQERPNIFTQSVANIEPGKTIDIVVRYVQDLAYDEGLVEMVFPMVVGPRYMPGAPAGGTPSGAGTHADTTRVPDASRISPPILGSGERTGNDISLAVTVRGATSLRDLETPTHAVTTGQAADGSVKIALAAKDKIPNRDFVMRYRTGSEKPAATLYTSGNDSGYFTLVVHPPALDVNELVGRREIVFVVDVSGSMSGQPLSLCKQAMREALSQLRPVDTFNVITFAGSTGKLFPAARRATQESIGAARAYVDQMSAGGGTEMLNAVTEALSPDVEAGRHRYVFFMTDGYVGNEGEIIDATARFVKGMEAKGQRGRVFGFGVGGSPNRFLMDGLVRSGKGVAITATNREDPGRAVNRFFRYIDRSVVRDVKIDFGGMSASEVMPAALPDLFASRALIVHGRFTGKATGPIVVRGTGASGKVEIPVRVATAPADDGWSILGLLWARSKITWLGDGLSEDEGAKPAITKLGLDYHLVTQFTSFVAVDTSKVVSNGAPAQVTVPVEVPEGVDPVAAGAGSIGGQTYYQSLDASAQAAPAGGGSGGGAKDGGYGYEFSDDPLASGGFGPNDATIRARPAPLMADESPAAREARNRLDMQVTNAQIAASPRGPRGCNCEVAGDSRGGEAPWRALALLALCVAGLGRRAGKGYRGEQ